MKSIYILHPYAFHTRARARVYTKYIKCYENLVSRMCKKGNIVDWEIPNCVVMLIFYKFIIFTYYLNTVFMSLYIFMMLFIFYQGILIHPL